MKYIKKPTVIEAIQWTGDNLSEIQRFYKPDKILIGDQIHISTPEGYMLADKGDWIVRGYSSKLGIHYWPVKPDYFSENYEPYEINC